MKKPLQSCCFSFFLLSPALLWSDPANVEPAGNSLTVESSANTSTAQAVLPTPAETLSVLPEVVVTANRLDTPVSQVTSSLTVLTAKELEQKQSRTMLDALQEVPGLQTVQSGGEGQIDSLFTRGANSENTLVMMDGIPLNDPIGSPYSYDYLDQMSVEGLSRVEVVRGPQSTLYGSNAMAGVVNILTQEGKGPLAGSLSFEGGSYGNFRETGSAWGGDEKGNFLLSLTRLDSTGFPILPGGTVNNGNQNWIGSLKMASSLEPNLREDLLVRNSLSHTSLDAYDPYSFLLTDDPNYFVDQDQWLVGSHTRWTVDGSWEQTLGLSFVDDKRQYNATPNADTAYYEQGNYDGQEVQLDWQNNLRLSPQETLVAGFQGQEQWGNSTDSNNGYGVYDGLGNAMTLTDSVTGANAALGSLFLNSQANLDGRLFLNLGGRVDLHSQFGTHGTYQAGAAYFIPGPDTKLKATLGTGFMAPSLYQLYDPTYGNTGLQPEQSTGFEAGFEQALGKGLPKFGVTYYHTNFTNLITTDNAFHFANIAQAQSEGWEAFLSVEPLKGLRCQATYTYTWAFDVQTGQELLRRPQNKADLQVFYSLGSTEWGALVSYVGDRLDYNPATFGSITNPEYFLIKLRASWRLDEHLQFFARVDNLLNQAYQEVYGFASPGFSVFGGTKVAF